MITSEVMKLTTHKIYSISTLPKRDMAIYRLQTQERLCSELIAQIMAGPDKGIPRWRGVEHATQVYKSQEHSTNNNAWVIF